jgi:hypothetical protein
MALALDGNGHGNSGTGTVTASLTTTHAGDVILAFVTDVTGAGVMSGGGLSWTKHPQADFVNTGGDHSIDLWYAVASSTLSAATISYNGGSGFSTLMVFGISGADTSTIFDAAAVKADTDPISISTTAANTFIVSCDNSGTDPTGSGTGFTLIDGNDFAMVQYKIVSSAQTGLSIPIGPTGTSHLMVALAVKAAAAASFITGWQTEAADVYVAKPQKIAAAPAFISTFRTAGVAGIAWSGPRDHVRLPLPTSLSTPPASGRVPATVPISGMAWDTLKENDRLPKGGFLTDPAALVFKAPLVTWSFGVGDTVFLRDAPVDAAPGFARPLTQPVGISGMAWFVRADDRLPARRGLGQETAMPPFAAAAVTWSFSTFDPLPARRAIAEQRPGFVQPIVTTSVPVSGMAWYAAPDRNRPALRIALEAPPSLALTPATLPVAIAGMAWFALPGERWPVRVRFDQAPAAPLQQQSQAAVGISGMAWFIPADERRAGRFAFDQAAAFGPAAVPAVGVSGMAWQVPQDDRLPVRRGLGQETALPPFAAAAVTWSFSAFDPLPLRRAIGEQRPGFVQPVVAASVPVSGMAWFAPFDQVRPRVRISVEAPAAFGRAIAPPVGISGMAWLVQPSAWGAVRRVPIEQLQSFVGEVIAGTVVVYDSPRAVAVAAELRVASPAAQARQISLN